MARSGVYATATTAAAMAVASCICFSSFPFSFIICNTSENKTKQVSFVVCVGRREEERSLLMTVGLVVNPGTTLRMHRGSLRRGECTFRMFHQLGCGYQQVRPS